MFDFAKLSDPSCPAPADELRRLADTHRDALLDAASWLGDRPGLWLAQAALDGLADAGLLSRRTLRLLDELFELLTLEHVHDPLRIEASRFASIDPASPDVEEICLLADQLGEAIGTYRGADTPELVNEKKVAA